MSRKLSDISSLFARFGDLVLAVLVVCIIGLLIIPLPSPVEIGRASCRERV